LSVGLRVRGRYRTNLLGRPTPAKLLETVRERWQELQPDAVEFRLENSGQAPALWVRLHPGVEPAEVNIAPPGTVTISANTSSGGPGYHRRLCADLQAVGAALGIAWESSDGDEILDETGYFESGDFEAVDRAMLDWLKALLKHVSGLHATQVALSMPLGFIPVGYGTQLLTVMGPRNEEWRSRGADDPRTAIDVFPWWSDRWDAKHYRDRALARMWVDVRWTTPTDDECRQALSDSDRDLNRALELDRDIELPWREWLEIRHLLRAVGVEPHSPEIDASVKSRASGVRDDAQLVGYRRGLLRSQPFQSWTIEIPGSFSSTFEDDVWVAWDDSRSVRLTSLTVRAKDGSALSARELVGATPVPREPIGPGDPKVEGLAGIGKDEATGDPVVQGVVATRGELLIVTIVFGDDESWGLATWHSIRSQASAS